MTAAPSPSESSRTFQRVPVLSAAVNLAEPPQFIEHLIACAENRTGRSVAGISAPYAAAMASDSALRDAFLKTDVLIPDGVGFVWGARALGVQCGDRLAIPDLCEKMLDAGNARTWKVFLYGATAVLNAAALANLRERFPNLATIKGQHGYDQTEADESALIARLRDEKFNLLIVARPSPAKEIFLARACREAGVVGIAAGGYADILAGAKKRAPAVVQAAGMEWFYRLIQDPGKLWKRIGWANAKFAAAVAWNVAWGLPRRPWFAQPILHVAAILTLVLLAYSRSLNAPYHFDDPEYILSNTAIRSFSTISQITVLARRPVWWYSNAICYKLSERFGNHTPDVPDVRIFRAWNIACHAVAALALYGLLRRVLRASALARAPALKPPIDLRPIAAAAIFAAHPLCTESVTYISGRDNGMGGMFYLLGLYFAAITFERLGHCGAGFQPALTVRWPTWFWPAFWSLLCGVLAGATKESYYTFPVAIPLVYFCFYRRGELPAISVGLLAGILAAFAALGWGVADLRQGRLWPAAQLAAAALIAGGLIGGQSPSSLAPRAFFQKQMGAAWAFLIVIGGAIATTMIAVPYASSRLLAAFTGYQGSSYVRSLSSQAVAVPAMFGRALAPFRLTFFPDFNLAHSLSIDHQFPSISDPHDPRTLAGAAVLLVLIALALAGAWRGWLGAFGALLALLSILPTNTVIERGDIVSERNFYLVAAGGACVLAWIAGGIAAFVARKIVASQDPPQPESLGFETGIWTLIVAFCFAGPFTAFTTLRNNEWGDPYRLWKSAMEHSPEKMRVLYNFGVSARGSDEAEMAFSRAIKIGEERLKRGDFRPDEAVEIKCFHLAYWQLAKIHLQHFQRGNNQDFNELQDIRKIYDYGLNRTAFDPDLAMTYSDFLIKLGRAPETVTMLRKSLELHSWADQLYLPLGIGSLESGDFPAAAHFLEKALLVKDESSLGYIKEMSADYRAQVSAYLGVAHARQKNPEKAKGAFREALRLNPDSIVPILFGYNSTRNFRLPVQKTPDQLLNSISQLRGDVVRGLRDAAIELLASKSEPAAQSVARLKEVFDYELARRADYQKTQLEKGIKDDPDKE